MVRRIHKYRRCWVKRKRSLQWGLIPNIVQCNMRWDTFILHYFARFCPYCIPLWVWVEFPAYTFFPFIKLANLRCSTIVQQAQTTSALSPAVHFTASLTLFKCANNSRSRTPDDLCRFYPAFGVVTADTCIISTLSRVTYSPPTIKGNGSLDEFVR